MAGLRSRYYTVYSEDPDRIKLELVYVPGKPVVFPADRFSVAIF